MNAPLNYARMPGPGDSEPPDEDPIARQRDIITLTRLSEHIREVTERWTPSANDLST